MPMPTLQPIQNQSPGFQQPGQGQPMMPGQGQPDGQGEMSPEQFDAQLKQMVSQMPPELLNQIASMDGVQALKMIMEKPNPQTGKSLLEELGGDKILASQIAQELYKNILEVAQVKNNKTIGMMNPAMEAKARGQMQGQGQPQGQPQGPAMPTLQRGG